MNVPWGIIAPQGPHLQHSTSARLEHGATRLSLSELISVQNVLPGKDNNNNNKNTFISHQIIMHHDYAL